ncbi:MAG: hypothetical protein KatS3mg027_0865 [Bacteroidia bacterium]|nr:MAG: hypothetical protein KatS3mg027_0865 [Bacteroidia bacterium]
MCFLRTWVISFVINLGLFLSNFIIAQTKVSNGSSEQNIKAYIPLVNSSDKVECSSYELCQKDKCIQFLKYGSNIYLKVFFETTKDTLKSQPIEVYKREIEIKSGTKSYYKREWSIYHENHQLFFVLLLPTNYLKTVSSDGITKILVNNQEVISYNKKETQNIKDIANILINNQAK